jgi:hypothetical protein
MHRSGADLERLEQPVDKALGERVRRLSGGLTPFLHRLPGGERLVLGGRIPLGLRAGVPRGRVDGRDEERDVVQLHHQRRTSERAPRQPQHHRPDVAPDHLHRKLE